MGFLNGDFFIQHELILCTVLKQSLTKFLQYVKLIIIHKAISFTKRKEMKIMKKLSTLFVTAVLLTLISVISVAAYEPYYPPEINGYSLSIPQPTVTVNNKEIDENGNWKINSVTDYNPLTAEQFAKFENQKFLVKNYNEYVEIDATEYPDFKDKEFFEAKSEILDTVFTNAYAKTTAVNLSLDLTDGKALTFSENSPYADILLPMSKNKNSDLKVADNNNGTYTISGPGISSENQENTETVTKTINKDGGYEITDSQSSFDIEEEPCNHIDRVNRSQDIYTRPLSGYYIHVYDGKCSTEAKAVITPDIGLTISYSKVDDTPDDDDSDSSNESNNKTTSESSSSQTQISDNTKQNDSLPTGDFSFTNYIIILLAIVGSLFFIVVYTNKKSGSKQ